MDHRALLDPALRALSPDRAAYLRKVIACLQNAAELEDRRHLLYPILALAAPRIEPILDPAGLAKLAAGFVVDHADAIAAKVYAPQYLKDGAAVLGFWGELLLATFAQEIMAEVQSGRIPSPEQTVWTFRAETPPPEDFPYADDDTT